MSEKTPLFILSLLLIFSLFIKFPCEFFVNVVILHYEYFACQVILAISHIPNKNIRLNIVKLFVSWQVLMLRRTNPLFASNPCHDWLFRPLRMQASPRPLLTADVWKKKRTAPHFRRISLFSAAQSKIPSPKSALSPVYPVTFFSHKEGWDAHHRRYSRQQHRVSQ